jgi:hypothetical protein
MYGLRQVWPYGLHEEQLYGLYQVRLCGPRQRRQTCHFGTAIEKITYYFGYRLFSMRVGGLYSALMQIARVLSLWVGKILIMGNVQRKQSRES